MTTATDLARAAAKVHKATAALVEATAKRDHLIAQRHTEGASLRTIAAEAGVSHQTVVNIVKRSSP